MFTHGRNAAPVVSDRNWPRVEFMLDFWHQLRVSDNTGLTTWEELVGLERNVVDCLAKGDLGKAESFTARAMLLIAGRQEDS
jgi:hypothetical protein